jgi:hypothetical protein
MSERNFRAVEGFDQAVCFTLLSKMCVFTSFECIRGKILCPPGKVFSITDGYDNDAKLGAGGIGDGGLVYHSPGVGK